LVLSQPVLFPPRRSGKHLQTKIPLREIIFALDVVQKSPTVRVATFPLEQSQEYQNVVVGSFLLEAKGTSAFRRRDRFHRVYNHAAFAVVFVRRVVKGTSQFRSDGVVYLYVAGNWSPQFAISRGGFDLVFGRGHPSP
jgi:hypothetical protein